MIYIHFLDHCHLHLDLGKSWLLLGMISPTSQSPCCILVVQPFFWCSTVSNEPDMAQQASHNNNDHAKSSVFEYFWPVVPHKSISLWVIYTLKTKHFYIYTDTGISTYAHTYTFGSYKNNIYLQDGEILKNISIRLSETR